MGDRETSIFTAVPSWPVNLNPAPAALFQASKGKYCLAARADPRGAALGQANGIQALDRSRQVIALCGDGGFNMLMREFLTAVHQSWRGHRRLRRSGR
ncbi:thiamine pyrophosphate-dependent enzyme [Roseiarcus sp.]|uniref:thiamine pyrophosphate-dependent enzyme n=1 Tax=Roseiarcus sp. TaxID=1969460 RepID=UPI003C71D33D